jgi:uncharacterized protein (TIGR02145 family)
VKHKSIFNAVAVAVTAVVLLTVFGVYAQTKSAPPISTFKDSRDGKTYKTVKVGSQTWFAENLNFAAEDSKCYGEGGVVVVFTDEEGNDTHYSKLSNAELQANCAKYGRLYDWETANKACPAGFHLPSDKEWTTLVNYAGGEEKAGTKLKSKARRDGTDDYGWSALLGGFGLSDGSFVYAGANSFWWSATEYDANYAWTLGISYSNTAGTIYRNKSQLYSARCVQD